jgi:hypothetical protein
MRIFLFLTIAAIITGCSEEKAVGTKAFFNIDSLVSFQVQHLKGRYELNKFVQIDGKEEHTRFVPDSLQWANELDIFRQIDQVNKAAFRDAYVVSDSRDTNSNLTVRELKAQGDDTPVSVVRFFYLRDPADIRKIEATMREENALYVNTRQLTMEFEPANSIQLIQRYRIEGIQKMVMSDSVRFVIAGEVAM